MPREARPEHDLGHLQDHGHLSRGLEEQARLADIYDWYREGKIVVGANMVCCIQIFYCG